MTRAAPAPPTRTAPGTAPVVHTGLTLPTLTMASEDSCIAGTCQPTNATDRSDQATAAQLALGAIDGDHELTITNDYLTAFLDHVAHDQPEPQLTNPDAQCLVTR